MKLRLRRNGYTPRHQYQEGPVLRSEVPPVTPVDIPSVEMANAAAVFVTNDGQVIPPGHPAYRWLNEMEQDFRRHLRNRAMRARQIVEHARIDAQMLVTGKISAYEIRKIIVDRARMANGMRPRARVSTRPVPRSTYVRGLA